MAFTLSHSPAHNGYLYFKLQMVMMQFIMGSMFEQKHLN